MKILSHKNIISLDIKPESCYHWVQEMLKEKENAILPAKTSIRPSDGMFYNIMPSILPQKDVAGLKVVTRYPVRVPSLDSQIMLFDYNEGKIDALLDANYITAMRTGAVAAHSIMLLGKKNFEIISFIGLGNQARATIKVLVSILRDKKLTLKLYKYKNQHVLFEEYVKSLPGTSNISFEYCDSYQDAVRNSEVIISSVTYLSSDICEDECFEEGCLLVPIHTRGFMNCDLFFDKVFVDDTSHVKGFKYFDKFKKFAEVSDILSGKSEGRQNNKERIIAYNIGLSIHDVYFAKKIFQLANKNRVGSEIDLNPPVEKFWLE